MIHRTVSKGTINNNGKLNSLLFERSQFIIRLVKISQQKLKAQNEHFLVKGLNWVLNQVSESLLFKSDEMTVTKLDEMKKENSDMKCLLGWLEDYSTIKINSIGKEKLKKVAATTNSKGISLNEIKTIVKNTNQSNKDTLNPLVKFITFTEECINTIENQSFNIFKFESEVGAENTLIVISCYIFTTFGFYSIIKYGKFEKFIRAITKGYIRANPYHNDLHAADIVQTCMIYLMHGNLKEFLQLDDCDQCSLFISCIVHDFKHPGVNNGFLINSSDPIAIKYNDINVLENYHVAQTFKLVKENDELNIFAELKGEDYRIFRKRMIKCILATDMIFHAKQFSFLKLTIEKYSISKGNNSNQIIKGDKMELFNIQQDFLDIIMHACDISNPTKPYDIYTHWADKVMEEFWMQGDKEKALGMSVSFLCDRNSTTKAQGQVGFIEGVVTPYFVALVEIFPGLNFLIDNVNSNKIAFKKFKEEEEKAKAALNKKA